MNDAKRIASRLRGFLDAHDVIGTGDEFVSVHRADVVAAVAALEANMLIDGLHDTHVALEEARRERDEARRVALEEREQKHWAHTSAENTAIMNGWKKA